MKYFSDLVCYVNNQGINGTITKKDGTIVPLGYMVQDGNTKVAEKRKINAKLWAKSYRARTSEALELKFKNTPVSGFEFVDSVERFRTSNKLFRIADPRGFVLEISVENAIELIQQTSIINGVIGDACLWIRDGQVNRLVKKDSDQHKKAMANSQASSSTTTAEPGDLVITKSNEEMIFIGKYSVIYEINKELKVTTRYFLRKESSSTFSRTTSMSTNPVNRIVSKNFETINLDNEDLHNESWHSSKGYSRILAVSPVKLTKGNLDWFNLEPSFQVPRKDYHKIPFAAFNDGGEWIFGADLGIYRHDNSYFASLSLNGKEDPGYFKFPGDSYHYRKNPDKFVDKRWIPYFNGSYSDPTQFCGIKITVKTADKSVPKITLNIL